MSNGNVGNEAETIKTLEAKIKLLTDVITELEQNATRTDTAINFIFDMFGVVVNTYDDPSQSGRRRQIDPMRKPLKKHREAFLYGQEIAPQTPSGKEQHPVQAGLPEPEPSPVASVVVTKGVTGVEAKSTALSDPELLQKQGFVQRGNAIISDEDMSL